MQPNKIVKIRYSKALEEGTEETERTIIPTVVPGNIRGLDITELNVEQQNKLGGYCEEYAEYLGAHTKLAFSFENWLSHSKGVDFTPKWRSFKPNQTHETT